MAYSLAQTTVSMIPRHFLISRTAAASQHVGQIHGDAVSKLGQACGIYQQQLQGCHHLFSIRGICEWGGTACGSREAKRLQFAGPLTMLPDLIQSLQTPVGPQTSHSLLASSHAGLRSDTDGAGLRVACWTSAAVAEDDLYSLRWCQTRCRAVPGMYVCMTAGSRW